MKSRHTVLLAATIFVTSCATGAPGRRPAAEPNRYQRHIDILNSIPLVPGVEHRASDEKRIADEVAKIFANIEQEGLAKQGHLQRGTHAKGTCLPGITTIFSEDDLKRDYGYTDAQVDRLRQGIFKLDGSYPAKIRFANAEGYAKSDLDGDVRGFSFVTDFGDRLQNYAGDGWQDFMLNNTPLFAVNDAHEFLEMMKAIRLSRGELHVINPLYAGAVARAVKFGKIYQTSDVKSYATESYWSNLPYTHGPDLVKYKAARCDGAPVVHEPSKGKSPNYLQDDITATAASTGVCFLLQVQFFDLARIRHQPAGIFKSSHPRWSKVQWVENGGELWDEGTLPFETIAKVEVPAGSQTISCDDWYANTRLHSTLENQPVGSVARLRTLIEEQSRARRMGDLR